MYLNLFDHHQLFIVIVVVSTIVLQSVSVIVFELLLYIQNMRSL